jgi:plasmid maintenance system antidote protein VapI
VKDPTTGLVLPIDPLCDNLQSQCYGCSDNKPPEKDKDMDAFNLPASPSMIPTVRRLGRRVRTIDQLIAGRSVVKDPVARRLAAAGGRWGQLAMSLKQLAAANYRAEVAALKQATPIAC